MANEGHVSEWTMHYHGPWHTPTKTFEVYYATDNGDKIVMAFPKERHTELAKMVEISLNGIDAYVPNRHHKTIQRIFHGPWMEDQLNHCRVIEVSEPAMKELVRIIYFESAERHMVEANYKILQEEFTKLKRAHEIQGQQLLRAQAASRANRSDFTLIESPFTPSPPDLMDDEQPYIEPELALDFCQQVGRSASCS